MGRSAARHEAPGDCPVCGDGLTIVRLECTGCGTGIDGAFTMGGLFHLSRDQLRFVETFLRSRGKIKAVEEELGVSYPTVVSRLSEVIAALGLEPGPDGLREPDGEPGVAGEDERGRIIEALYAGELTVDDALARLREND
jgi:hypothetical protein